MKQIEFIKPLNELETYSPMELTILFMLESSNTFQQNEMMLDFRTFYYNLFGTEYGASNINIKKKFEEAVDELYTKADINLLPSITKNSYNINFAPIYGGNPSKLLLPIEVVNIFKDATLGLCDTSKINLFKAYLILLDNMTLTSDEFSTLDNPVGLKNSVTLSKKIGVTKITYKKYVDHLQKLNLLYVNDTPIYYRETGTGNVKRFPNVYSLVNNKETVDRVINQRQQTHKSLDKDSVSCNIRYTSILTWINRGKSDYDIDTLQSVYKYATEYNQRKDKLISETDQRIIDKYPNKFKKMDITRLESLLRERKIL